MAKDHINTHKGEKGSGNTHGTQLIQMNMTPQDSRARHRSRDKQGDKWGDEMKHKKSNMETQKGD